MAPADDDISATSIWILLGYWLRAFLFAPISPHSDSKSLPFCWGTLLGLPPGVLDCCRGVSSVGWLSLSHVCGEGHSSVTVLPLCSVSWTSAKEGPTFHCFLPSSFYSQILLTLPYSRSSFL